MLQHLKTSREITFISFYKHTHIYVTYWSFFHVFFFSFFVSLLFSKFWRRKKKNLLSAFFTHAKGSEEKAVDYVIWWLWINLNKFIKYIKKFCSMNYIHRDLKVDGENTTIIVVNQWIIVEIQSLWGYVNDRNILNRSSHLAFKKREKKSSLSMN